MKPPSPRPLSAAIKPAKNLHRFPGVFREGAERTHDERDRHGGLKTFSAYVAKHDQRAAVFLLPRLEEIFPT